MRLAKFSFSSAQQYLLHDVQQARLRNGVRWLTLGIALLIGIWIIYYLWFAITYPFPLIYDEGGQQVTTQFLLEGRNPFSLVNQPLGLNNYGIIYSLTALPLAAMFGNTLLVHRIVTLVFLLLCSVIGFRSTYKGIENAGLAIVCSEMIMVALASFGGLRAFPASMGTFFFLAAVLVPFNRHFDRVGLVLSAVLCLLAFYTKPYFLIAFCIVSTYLFLFESKKKALVYGLFFIILFSIVFLIVRTELPFYFFDVILINFNQSGTDQFGYIQGQALLTLREFWNELFPALIVAVTVLLVRRPSRSSGGTTAQENVPPGILSILDRPLLSIRFNYLAYTCICGLLAFLLIQGVSGNFVDKVGYGSQLFLTPFCLWLFCELRPRSRLSLILVPLLLINLVLFCQIRFKLNDLTIMREEIKGWTRLYKYVDSSNRILNSPLIVSEMLRRGLWPVDTGLNYQFFMKKDCPEIGWLIPGCNVIKKDGEHYLDTIHTALSSRSYRLVISTQKNSILFDENLIHSNYYETELLTILMPLTQEKLDVVVWKRRLGTH